MRKSSERRTSQARVIGLPFDAQLHFEQPQSLSKTNALRKSLLLICDQIPPSADLLYLLNKMFDVKVVVDPIAGLLALQSDLFDQVVIVLESVQSNLWVMLRSLDTKITQAPIPLLLFAPGMEASQMQKAYGLGVLFCCSRQLDARYISNQLTAFAGYHDRLRQSVMKKAGLHDDLLQTPSYEQKFLAQFDSLIKSKFSQADLSVHEITKYMGISISTLERKSLQLTGMQPRAYLNEHRLLHAYQLIISTSCSVQEASLKSGFANSSYFSIKFLMRFKIKPSNLLRSETKIA